MSVPKKRRSRSKVRKSKTHKKIKAVGSFECSNCKSPKEPHKACNNCGQHKGKTILDTSKRDARAERKRKAGR